MIPSGPTRHLPIALTPDQNDLIAEELGHARRTYEVAAAACPALPKVAYGNSSVSSVDAIARHYPYPKRYRRSGAQWV